MHDGTSHNQYSPWISPMGLIQGNQSNELNFLVTSPTGDMQYLPAPEDFLRNFPYISAAGGRQHP